MTKKIFSELNKVYEGSEKILFDGPDKSTLIQRFKDEVLLNGKAVSVKGRGIFNNKISQYIMSKLSLMGVKTHFIRSYSIRDQVIKSLDMFPFKVVVRNAPSSEMINDFSVDKNLSFIDPIVEFVFKNSHGKNIRINSDHILSFCWATKDDLNTMESMVLRINDFLQGYFFCVDIKLIDISLEFGKDYDLSSYSIILGDSITLDSMNLLDIKNKIKFESIQSSTDDMLEIYRDFMSRMKILELPSVNKK
jgi:phosphoribosylaminoimidazole-succinocarboxamide synthase